MEREVYIAAAFCKNGTGGNLAGVVLQAEGMTAAEKMRIAGELGFSETVFLSASETADLKLEYFTPTDEVELCGHATIAAFSVLYLLDRLKKREYRIETKAGGLNVYVQEDGLVLMEQNPPKYGAVLDKERIYPCLGMETKENAMPIRIVSTGLRDILVPVDSFEKLNRMEPDFDRMKIISREENVIGMHAFALAEDPKITAFCRNFAPLYGIDEESATGTSNCALACYLYKAGIRKPEYVFEQGHKMGKTSRILVRIEAKGEEILKVFAGGSGMILEQRTI